MANRTTTPATQVTSKFRKDVEQVSKDKVRGYMVQHFRMLFSPAEIMVVRTRAASETPQTKPKRHPRKAAKKRKKA